MNAKDVNGLMRWENIVTGTATNQLLLSDGVGVNGRQMSLYHAVAPGAGVDLGYNVLYELQKQSGGAWRRIAGPVDAAVPSFSVELLDSSGGSTGASGLYRLVTLLVPRNELSITNSIPTTNCVVVLEVDSTARNTMTSVPVGGLATAPDNGKSVTVDKLVNVTQLSDGDKVYAMDDSGTYQQWTLSNGSWQAAAATIRKVGGSMRTIETPEADERELDRNNAIWVVRSDSSKPYFLVGQYCGEAVTVSVNGGTAAAKGCTMLPNPGLRALGINDINWGNNPVANDDVITIPSVGNLRWDSSNKVWWRTVQTRDPVTRKPVKSIKTDDVIPAGQAVWYYRAGPTFTVSIESRGFED